MTAKTKTADLKGRIALGAEYAGKTFLVEARDSGELIFRPAVVVPEPEAWLYRNGAAMKSVQRGLKQARDGKLNRPPADLDLDD